MTISVNSRKKQAKKSFDELLNDLRTSNSEKSDIMQLVFLVNSVIPKLLSRLLMF